MPTKPRFDATENLTGERRAISLSGEFEASGLPKGIFAWWQPSGKARLIQDGATVATAQDRAVRGGRPQLSTLFPPANTPHDRDSLLAALPEGTKLPRPDNLFMMDRDRSPNELGTFTAVTPGQELASGDLSLEIDLTARVYQYETLLNAPLNEMTAVTTGPSRIVMRPALGARQGMDIAVACPALGVSTNPFTANWNIHPFRAWRVYLWLPAANIALPGTSVSQRHGPLLAGGSAHREVFEFQGLRNRDANYDTTGARVIILNPKHLGLKTKQVTVPAKLKIPQNGAADFNGFLFQLQKPEQPMPARPDPATASTDEFAPWLTWVLGDRSASYEPTTAELACWVPNQLPTLMSTPTPNFVNSGPFISVAAPPMLAIEKALPNSRRFELIKRLPSDPRLARIVYLRGWQNDARQELLALSERGADMDFEGWLAVASLREPKTYARLLHQLEASSNVPFYEALRTLPGIESQLDAAVKRYYARIALQRPGPGGRTKIHARVGLLGTLVLTYTTRPHGCVKGFIGGLPLG